MNIQLEKIEKTVNLNYTIKKKVKHWIFFGNSIFHDFFNHKSRVWTMVFCPD
jgi:hypothetical protein